MKKKAKQRGPSTASLRAVPSVDFSAYKKARRNPFAKRMHAEGWQLVHEGPSKSSLKEIPPVASGTKARVNPYARRIHAHGIELQVGRRRPARGEEVGPTAVKSVRLPPAVWKRLEKQAKSSGVALHALVRVALLEWLENHAA